jgi:hypothetical protein
VVKNFRDGEAKLQATKITLYSGKIGYNEDGEKT